MFHVYLVPVFRLYKYLKVAEAAFLDDFQHFFFLRIGEHLTSLPKKRVGTFFSHLATKEYPYDLDL